MEGLVKYNFSTPSNCSLIPALAEEWIWENNTRISFKIREDITFHDGTPLNASAVKWNFDRLMYFCNTTGSLPKNATSWQAFPSYVYFLTNGTYIFKSFEINGNYNFTINLNTPFGPLLDLLTFPASYILSPSSTPRYRYLNLTTEKLVGTGPFVFDSYIQDLEIRFHAYTNYWQGKTEIEEMIWLIEENKTVRMNAALAGEYDYVCGVTKDYIDTFKSRPDEFIVKEVGEDLCYFYLEIYCGPRDTDGTHLDPGNPQYQKNPAWLRRALALAINYTYIYEEIQEGYAFPGVSAVPRAMPGHNFSVVQAHDYSYQENLIKARFLLKDNSYEIMQRGGIDISGFDVYNDADWEGKNILGRDIEVNRHFGSTINERLNNLLENNFDLIGIQIHETIREWDDYLDTGMNIPWGMDLAYIGWCPDYLNPYNIINPLFNLDSHSCFSRINDSSTGGLTEMMNSAVVENDLETQYEIWKRIQSYIYDIDRPLNPASHAHISCWVYLIHAVHAKDLVGVNYNVMGLLDFYSCEWNKITPGYFRTYSNADVPDTDGEFNLTWDASALADNYSIYRSNSSITQINSNVTEIANGILNLSYPISILDNETVYFMVVAFNEAGNRSSNCINVTVQLVPPDPFELTSDAGTPDKDGKFSLNWSVSAGADNYSVYTYHNYITEINQSISLLANKTATSPFFISGLSNGIYYYVIVAYNEGGYTLSNCINVSVQLILPDPFELTSDADILDGDGAFNLSWTVSAGADNYSIYTYHSYITEINQSVILLANQNATSPYFISELPDGIYYYVIVAYNESGSTFSNNIHVTVKKYYSSDGYWIISPLIIDGTGKTGYTWSQVASSVEWCSGSGTTTDPYIIDSILIDGKNSTSCIIICNSDDNFQIINSIFLNSSSEPYAAGIKLFNMSNGELTNVDCSFNNNFGIILINCVNIIIQGSDINNNSVGGIYLLESNSNEIINNDDTINNNGQYGIKLNSSSNNLIRGNVISNNFYGIFILQSNYNTVENNILIENDKSIIEEESEGNTVGDNTIKKKDDGFQLPKEILILIISVAAIVILGITGAYVLKKKIATRELKKKEISEKKKEKMRKKLEKKMEFIDYLIEENKIKLAYKNLGKVKDNADKYEFFDIFNKANKKVEICKEIEAGISRVAVKEEIITSKAEKKLEERPIILPLTEKEVEEKLEGVSELKVEGEKYKIFLSYSTLDSDYFQISRIVKKLELYPKIERVLYWEADSARNIVEYMEETLKATNIFVLFCSENSSKSSAVKDEWQAAFQLRKKGKLKLIPVYMNEEYVPALLMPLLNVKFSSEDFDGFIEKLYEEILREEF